MKSKPLNSPLQLTTEQKVGANLRRLRKAAKVSQIQLAEILQVHQSAISRLENGEQAILVSQLVTVSQFFGVDPSAILNGRLNLWQVAARFNAELPIPDRYKRNVFSKVREITPIIAYLNEVKGPAFTLNLFQTYNIESVLFASSDQDISTNCILDILRNLLQNNVIDTSRLVQLVGYTQNETYHNGLLPVYNDQLSVNRLIQAYVFNTPFYGHEYQFDISASKNDTLTIVRRLNPTLYATVDRDPQVNQFLCEYRQSFISQLPVLMKKPPLQVTRQNCHEHGHRLCTYQLELPEMVSN